MRNPNGRATRALLLALAWLAAGCDGDIAYRDRSTFEQLPSGAGEFLGYSTVATKRTTCGNCHVGKQAVWEKTAHASTFAKLESSGAMQDVCQACHTVSSKGNITTAESVGWVATKNPRYQDVQCESCHGPGLAHVTNPDESTKPLATIVVDTSLTRGCGECHSGEHRPFAEEWRRSKHARVVVSRATNVSCSGCHEAKSVLQAWGVNSTFMQETGEHQYPAVTCAVCHDPHSARNRGQLRFAIDVPSVEANLCMKCHRRRANPDLASASSGPHSPEGPMLLGEAGWMPPNFQYPAGALVGSHGSDSNPRLCAACHVTDYEVRDNLTGAFTFRATGHSFQAIPCADANGVPTGVTGCALTERSFRSCVAGCHLSESSARTAYTIAEQRILRLVGELTGLLARIPATELSNSDGRYTTAEGAKFNVSLANKKGSIAHNPFLLEALLLASIKQIEIDYGLRPSSALSLQSELTPPARN